MRALILTMAMAARLAANDTAGRYALRGEHEMGSELVLRPDGGFEYMFVYGAADYSARGSWRQDGQAVVLTTEGKEEPPFRLVKSYAATKAPGTRVWVKSAGGRGIANIDVVMGGVTERTSQDGSAEFAPEVKAGPVTIVVGVYGLEAGPYALAPGMSDHVFEINGPAITTVRFKGERLTVQGNELLMKFWSADHAMRYSRVR